MTSRATRVAYLCEFPTLLGGERSLLTFLDHRVAAEVDPIVVAPSGGRLAAALATRGIRRVDWPPGGRRRPELLATTLGELEVEIVHANSLMTADAALGCARELGALGVAHVRDIMGLSTARLARLRELDALIAVSNAVGGWLESIGLEPARVHVIHNAVDGEALRRGIRPGALRAELGREGLDTARAPLIGCIGQIALRKGQDLFLEAATSIAERAADARFIIAGERYSEKEESVALERALQKTATSGALRGRAHLLGYRDDAASVIAALDLLVVPSRQEPLSRVLLEALALGVAAIATDVGGSREILAEGRCGRLVPPNDARALAEGVLDLLAQPSERRRLAAAGLARSADFAPERQVEALRRLYDALRRGTRRRP